MHLVRKCNRSCGAGKFRSRIPVPALENEGAGIKVDFPAEFWLVNFLKIKKKVDNLMKFRATFT